MKRPLLIAIALLVSATAWAQGVNDPSTPNRNVIIVNPSQPAAPNATRNIPSRIQPPVNDRPRTRPAVLREQNPGQQLEPSVGDDPESMQRCDRVLPKQAEGR